VDVIPHLLYQLLIHTIPKHRERAQLAYKVALGLLHAYISQSVNMGLSVAFVFPAVKQFLKGVVVETHIVENAYMFAYATLTLLNTLLISGDQQDFIANRGQKKVVQSLQQP
jgi:hypothetical protein